MSSPWDLRIKDMFINNKQVKHAGIALTKALPSVDSYADFAQNIHHVADFTVVKAIIVWSVPYSNDMFNLLMEIAQAPKTYKHYEATIMFTSPEQHKPITISHLVIPGGEIVIPKSTEGGAQDVTLHGQYKEAV